MNSKPRDDKEKKEMLKNLRKERSHSIEAAKSRVKEQSRLIKKIKEELSSGGKTVPEVAAATEISAADVLWYLMALKKYGLISEGKKEGGYFRYHLASIE